MNQSMYLGALLGLLQSAVPLYGLRLKRLFGLHRVGWPLVIAFSALALSDLGGGWPAVGGLSQAEPVRALSYAVVPLLLLIGMAHIESLYRRRLRSEQEQCHYRFETQQALERQAEELAETKQFFQEELRRREVQLRAASQTAEAYHVALSENPRPMWVFDLRTFKILEANAAALDCFGYTRQEFLARTAQDLCPPEERRGLIETAARPTFARPSCGVFRYVTRNRHFLDAEARMIDLMHGDCPARLVYLTGTTEEVLAGHNLRADGKLQLTAQVAAGAAQHFNRHLAVIQVYANVLLHKGFDARTNEQHIRISAMAAEAARLGERLLACGCRRPTHCRSLDLSDVVQQRVSSLRRLAPAEVTLENHCPPDLPPALVDPSLCETILDQLVQNAGEATDGSGLISISADLVELDAAYARQHPGALAGHFVRLSVADNGRGLSQEAQDHLFEPFFTTKEASKHAGLGLASVRGLMKEQAGWVEIDNQPGRGVTVHLFFPCAEA